MTYNQRLPGRNGYGDFVWPPSLRAFACDMGFGTAAPYTTPRRPHLALTIRKNFDVHAEIAVSRDGRQIYRLEPRGFLYRDEIITEAEHAALAESLRQLDLKPFEFHGHLGNRRVASFGLKYDYSRRSVEPANQMPAFLDNLLIRVAEFAGTDPDAFRQVGVSEYRAGAGIGWHKDRQDFGIIVGVSLVASAIDAFPQTERDRMDTDLSHRAASIDLYSGWRGTDAMGA